MNHNFDIVIAGGGVIGSCIAYYLSQNKSLSIALIDYKKPGNATRASAGGLWPVGESVGLGCGVIFFRTLSKQMTYKNTNSKDKNSDIKNAHQLPDHFLDFAVKSKDLIDNLAIHFKEDYNVDFKHEKTGLKFIMYDEYDKLYAEQIVNGIPQMSKQIRWLNQAELKQQEPNISSENIGALEFTDDDQVNPYLLQQAYLEIAKRNNVTTFMHHLVVDIKKQRNRIHSVTLNDNQTLNCGLLINAAGCWASEIANMALGYKIPVHPVKGQVLLSEKLPKILNACISTSDCYIAQKDNGEILIGSTTEEQGYNTFCTYPELQTLAIGATRCIPYLKTANIKRSWAGLRPGTPDELPILGPVQDIDGYLNACGHFRTGIVTSAITGKIIDNLVHEQKPPLDITPYLLERFTQKNTTCYAKQYLGESAKA